MSHQLLRCLPLYVLSALLMFYASPLKAQSKKVTDGLQQTPIAPPQYFRFVLAMGAVQKAKHQNTEGTYTVGSSVQPGWEGGVDYLHNISSSFYYGLGAHLAVTGRSTLFHYPASAGNPAVHYEQYPPEKDRQFDPVLALPLFAEKQWQLATRKALYADAGMQLNIPISSDYTGFGISLQDSSGNYTEIYNQSAQAFHDGKPWLGCKLGAGLLWVLKNESLLGVGIVANLSFAKFMRGTYEVRVPGELYTRGVFTANGSYLGVQATYGLMRKYRKRVMNGA